MDFAFTEFDPEVHSKFYEYLGALLDNQTRILERVP